MERRWLQVKAHIIVDQLKQFTLKTKGEEKDETQ
jgi:hypothetical protein